MDATVHNRHTTNIYTDAAVDQIRTLKGSTQPFFMYLAYQAVHSPMQVEDRYVNGSLPTGCNSITSGGPHNGNRIKLCGMMAMLDESAKTLVTELSAVGRWESTVFVFLSDNGGIESHGSVNSPLRGEKGFYFEGGIRVPAFLSGGFVQHTLSTYGSRPYRSSAIVHTTDIHAMMLHLAGYASAPIQAQTSIEKGRRLATVGGDRDAHGCYTSAGFSWCASTLTCIRAWEQTCDATLSLVAPQIGPDAAASISSEAPPASGSPAPTSTQRLDANGTKSAGATSISDIDGINVWDFLMSGSSVAVAAARGLPQVGLEWSHAFRCKYSFLSILRNDLLPVLLLAVLLADGAIA